MAVRFDHFMEAALYDPGHGYYTSRIRTVGTRGDFSTTATLLRLPRSRSGQTIRGERRTAPHRTRPR